MLRATGEPFALFWKGRRVPLRLSEAQVAFELVRFGRISLERICLLAPLAEDGNETNLAHTRISQLRRKLRAFGADVKIINEHRQGYRLEA